MATGHGGRGRVIEWPTVALAMVIYGAWLAAVFSHDVLPWWSTAAVLAVVVAWHGSLQHEVIHGHPFRSRTANDALGSLPLSPRLPYQAYRRDHLGHHACDHLTDPVDDIESYYCTGGAWERLSPIGQRVALVNRTLAGRVILGPLLEITTVWARHIGEIRRGDMQLARWWVLHLLGAALLGAFVVGIADLPLGVYLLGLYVGHGLSLVRSYCEHRWVPGTASRSAVVRSGGFFGLLFLNNNLHHTHHAEPGAAWYRLPAIADRLHSDEAAAAGAGLYRSYFHVARHYLLKPFDEVVHPMHRTTDGAEPTETDEVGYVR